MTRSPTRNTDDPDQCSGLSSAAGLSWSWMSRPSAVAPVSPLRIGHSTCTCPGSTFCLRGIATIARCATRRATCSGSSSSSNQNPPPPGVEGSRPARMRWAASMMPLPPAWRKTWVSWTRGIDGTRSRSARTSPGPMLGSWSLSPMRSRWLPGRTAAVSRVARCRSSMDASSTTIRSACAGSSSKSVSGSGSGCWASMRCTVIAGSPVSSDSRLAALPVGAVSVTVPPAARTVVAMDLTVWLLPHPGPPVMIETVLVRAMVSAARWSSCRPGSSR